MARYTVTVHKEPGKCLEWEETSRDTALRWFTFWTNLADQVEVHDGPTLIASSRDQ